MEQAHAAKQGDRVVRWIEEFTRGLGVPRDEVDGLVAGVRGVFAHAQATDIEQVSVIRAAGALEVRLVGATGPRETFFLLM